MSGDIATLYAAVCELFEMSLLHTLRAFADMPIASIVSPTESQVLHKRLSNIPLLICVCFCSDAAAVLPGNQ